MSTRLTYRPDIDGLRALAVLAVILFHAEFGSFSGGFVGVDVFFVISGFLITGIVQREIDRSEFSLGHFYERRIRRLFPALFTVLATTTAAGWFVLLPNYFVDFSESLLATIGFVSNILFWRQSGYFGAHDTILLHTWSLAIEEQFYLIFPIFLLLVAKFARKYLLHGLSIVLLVSFFLSVWSVPRYPEATFYLAPTRAWELLIGAILAVASPRRPGRIVCNLLSLLGLAMLASAILFYSATTTFPGPTALVPCLAAALVIYAGGREGIWCNRALAWRPLVYIGVISYSLYLWHWPIFVFARHLLVRDMMPTEALTATAVAAILSVATYHLIEKRFRGPKVDDRATLSAGTLRSSRRQVFVAAGVGMAALLSVSVGIMSHVGFPDRFSPDVVRMAMAGNEPNAFHHNCVAFHDVPVRYSGLCKLGDPDAHPLSFLVWGDSHAISVLPALHNRAVAADEGGLVAAYFGCPPLIGVAFERRRDRPKCDDFNTKVSNLLQNRESLDTVVLVARWAMCAEGRGYKSDGDVRCRMRDKEQSGSAWSPNRSAFKAGLLRTVDRLTELGKRVFIIASVPEVGADVPFFIANAKLRGRQADIAPRLQEYLNRQAFVLDVLRTVAADDRVSTLYPHHVLCSSSRCKITDGRTPFYRDGNHLSATGATFISRIFEPLFSSGAVEKGSLLGNQEKTASSAR